MSNELILRDDSRLSATVTPTALALRDEALATSALIFRVDSPESNAEAAVAQTSIRTVKKMLEEARVAAKAPILEYGRAIDAVVRQATAELDSEEVRVARLIGDYLTKEQAKVRAAEALRVAELNRIERERQEALAKADSHEQMDTINAQADEAAKAAPPPVVIATAKGQVAREDWEVRHINELELAKAHPELVRKIVFDMRSLKALLDVLGSLPGVVANRKVKASVRIGRGEIVNV